MADTLATITLRSKLVSIRETRRLSKSFDYLRESVGRISKVSPQNVLIDKKLNEFLMVSPSRRLARMEVKISKEGENVRVMLANPVPPKKAALEAKPVAKEAPKKVEAAAKAEKKAEEKAPKAPKASKPKEKEVK